MATIKHSRTIALQATSPRIVAVPLPTNITADWTTNVTGTGKPADSATVNRIQTGTSFSGTPVDGDIWIDTNTSPAIVKTRIAGAWVSSANYTTTTTQLTDGAGLGTTADWGSVYGTGKPASYADVTTSILAASGTSIVMTNAQLFKSAAGVAGVFIGSGGIFGKNGAGATTFSIDGATGAATFAGALSAATGSFGAVTAGGAITVNTSGNISNGISYGGTGFFLGYSGGAYKFSVGNASSYLRWDGSSLSFTGALSAATGTFAGTLSAASITSGTLSANFINGGTLSGADIKIDAGGGLGWVLDVQDGATTVNYRQLSGNNITATNFAAPGSSAVIGASTTAAAGMYGSSSGAGGHGLRGEAGNGLGFVGYNGGTYDFYAYGSASNYGPFTGAHDALVIKGASMETGDIVCDVEVAVKKNVSNTICRVALSTEPNQSAAVGVVCTLARNLDLVNALPAAMADRFWSHPPDADPFETMIPVVEWYDLRLTHDAITINALGEGQINVCGEGGNLLPGDLITTSSTSGKGMRQADDVVRASSVAKCREAVTFDNPEQVRMVACIYLCG